MDRCHHLTHRVERNFSDPRLRNQKLGLFNLVFRCEVHECTLCRFADRISVLTGLGVVAERHSRCEKVFVSREIFDDGHLVLCERPRFVGAYDLCAAECLDRSELSDDSRTLRHLGNAYRENYGYHSGKSFGDRCNGKADRNHEGGKYYIWEVYTVTRDRSANGSYYKYDYTDADNYKCEDLGELGELLLKRSLFLGDFGESRGDLAHFGVHADRADYSFSAPVNDRAAHIDHI